MADERATAVAIPADAPQTYTCALPRDTRSVPLARHRVTAALSDWGLPGLADDAGLVLSELVANSVEHGRGDTVQVTVTRIGCARIRVAVTDSARRRPQLVTAKPDDEGGRGMLLVNAVAERWGVDVLRPGKRVWAELGATS